MRRILFQLRRPCDAIVILLPQILVTFYWSCANSVEQELLILGIELSKAWKKTTNDRAQSSESFRRR